LLQGVRLVRLQRVLGSLRGQGPSFLQQAQHPVAYPLSNRSTSPCVGGGNGSKRTPPSRGTKTPSGTSEWKCGVTCKAEPKNWMNDTAPT
jgi:hypothetical protein